MGQFTNFKDLRLPSGGLNEALEVLLLGQSLGEAVRQVAETVSPRSSGRPPPLRVVRAPERCWLHICFKMLRVLTCSIALQNISLISLNVHGCIEPHIRV